MTLRKQMALLLVVCMVFALAACGGNTATTQETSTNASDSAATSQESTAVNASKEDYSKKVTFSYSFFDVNDTFKGDPVYTKLAEKFNFDTTPVAVGWDNFGEKNRLWISSGDMPDVMFYDLNLGSSGLKDYLAYAKNGLIRALPEDLGTKYPNLSKIIETTGIVDFLKNKSPDGMLYAAPRPIFQNPITEVNVDMFNMLYRKDWVQKLGYTIGDTLTVDDLLKISKDMVTKDPGGLGENKTIGYSANMHSFENSILRQYNANFKEIYKNDEGKYVYGLYEPSTLEGVKMMRQFFDAGAVDRNFFTNKTEDIVGKFTSGQAGFAFENYPPMNYADYAKKFEFNTKLKAQDAVGICTLIGTDGKIHGTENLNFWSASLFSPKTDEETFQRILALMDYLCTPEGYNLINLGIENQDYTGSGDNIEITRAKDENGNFLGIDAVYPSLGYFTIMSYLSDGFSFVDPSVPEYIKSSVINLQKAKETIGLNINKIDMNVKFYTSPLYDKFELKNITQSESLTVKTVVSKGDVTKLWNDFVGKYKAQTDALLEEINTNLAEK